MSGASEVNLPGTHFGGRAELQAGVNHQISLVVGGRHGSVRSAGVEVRTTLHCAVTAYSDLRQSLPRRVCHKPVKLLTNEADSTGYRDVYGGPHSIVTIII